MWGLRDPANLYAVVHPQRNSVQVIFFLNTQVLSKYAVRCLMLLLDVSQDFAFTAKFSFILFFCQLNSFLGFLVYKVFYYFYLQKHQCLWPFSALFNLDSLCFLSPENIHLVKWSNSHQVCAHHILLIICDSGLYGGLACIGCSPILARHQFSISICVLRLIA